MGTAPSPIASRGFHRPCSVWRCLARTGCGRREQTVRRRDLHGSTWEAGTASGGIAASAVHLFAVARRRSWWSHGLFNEGASSRWGCTALPCHRAIRSCRTMMCWQCGGSTGWCMPRGVAHPMQGPRRSGTAHRADDGSAGLDGGRASAGSDDRLRHGGGVDACLAGAPQP